AQADETAGAERAPVGGPAGRRPRPGGAARRRAERTRAVRAWGAGTADGTDRAPSARAASSSAPERCAAVPPQAPQAPAGALARVGSGRVRSAGAPVPTDLTAGAARGGGDGRGPQAAPPP